MKTLTVWSRAAVVQYVLGSDAIDCLIRPLGAQYNKGCLEM